MYEWVSRYSTSAWKGLFYYKEICILRLEGSLLGVAVHMTAVWVCKKRNVFPIAQQSIRRRIATGNRPQTSTKCDEHRAAMNRGY